MSSISSRLYTVLTGSMSAWIDHRAGSKGAALLALLAGLYIVAQMRQQQRSGAGQPRP